MEEEHVTEGKEMADSYVSLEDEGDGCCVVEDIEDPMVLDDHGKDGECLNLEFSQHLVGGVVEPALGMGFTSEDYARNFYNSYAKQTGFSIRVNSYYRSKKDNSIISREFCCFKEGFRREKHRKADSGHDTNRRRARAITREGCKALMTVRRRDNAKWYVAKLEKNHNHELVTPAMRRFLCSHKEDGDPKKSLYGSLDSVGVGSNASSNVLFLVTPLPMEKQAAEVYTRKLFLVFQDEIYESLVIAVKSSQDDDGLSKTYEVARFDEEHKVYRVGLNIADQIASCSCKLFEFEGILCRHVIAVFKATNIFLLPQHYILKRWTKNAKEDAKFDALPPVDKHDDSWKGKKQYNLLYQEAIKCAEEGMASDHSFKVALNALREARIKIVSAKKNAINAQKLETPSSTNYVDDKT